jgi:parvulin-like peptidyl-prolyl isomerase
MIAAKVRLVLTITLGVSLSACSTSAPSQSNSSVSLPPVVATVNGRPISTRLYEMYLKNGRSELGLDPSTAEGRQKLDQLREGIVSELIDRAIIALEAEQRGLAIPAEKMAEAERHAIEELGGDQKYDTYLAEHGLSRDEYRETVRGQLYSDMLRAQLTKGVSVSDQEIATFYQAHRTDPAFQQQESVRASHILVAARSNLISQQLERDQSLKGDALRKAVTDAMEKRRQRSVELRRKAAAGADFAKLARESSDDQGTRGQGGDLGSFGRGSHPAAFDEAAFKLKAGAISDVVQTEYGFHIIKVFAHDPQRVQTLVEAKPEIQRRLFAEREAKNLNDWLTQARRKATVRISEPFRFGALKNEFPPQ